MGGVDICGETRAEHNRTKGKIMNEPIRIATQDLVGKWVECVCEGWDDLVEHGDKLKVVIVENNDLRFEGLELESFACGFFEGPRGLEIRGRLASRDPADFRSAMAECMACWFIAGRLGLPVSGDAPGRGTKQLDMRMSPFPSVIPSV